MTFFKSLTRRVRDILSGAPSMSAPAARPAAERARVDHVIILDGTLSTLEDGYETNAGLFYKLLTEGGPSAQQTVYYEAGVQWRGVRNVRDVIEGRGINRQIRRAYGYLASRYRPGDRIFLFGYSRGAYAVRSLAGVIDRVGLIKSEHATVRNIRTAYRHYQLAERNDTAGVFAERFCHDAVDIEMVGVWDTVKALGIRAPILWRFTQTRHAFHNHRLGDRIKHGFHALAMDESRNAFAPVLWEAPANWRGRIEQVWFRGQHSVIGGQLNGRDHVRPLSNIPLVWMLEKSTICGLALPADWKMRFPTDPFAPTVGRWVGWSKLFWSRSKRAIGHDRSETVHPSVEVFQSGSETPSREKTRATG